MSSLLSSQERTSIERFFIMIHSTTVAHCMFTILETSFSSLDLKAVVCVPVMPSVRIGV